MILDIIKNISQIIRFKSYEDEPKDGAPFGEGAKAALDFYLSLAEYLGFKTQNYDGYAGEVVFGNGKEFAILAHLDVVPAGSGWTHDPFGGEIDEENRKIWGRGAMDDKGPAIICLYALKALLDEGFSPGKKIKLIVGCNEETGSRCMKYYKEHANMPETGFSPDADFPVIYAEKGILNLEFTFKADGDFSALCGGERPNMVCDFVKFSGNADEAKAAACGLTAENGTVISRGKSAHSSTPEMGVNAIPAMLKYLGLNDIEKTLFDDPFGFSALHDETGSLTFSPNIISGGDGFVKVIVNIRYPATYTLAQITEILDKSGADYKIVAHQEPLFNDKQSKLITTLCKVYNEVSGTSLQPLAIGGGTYARELKCGAAFGPEEAGEENTVHQANEYITFDKIERCFEIYKRAIKELTK